MEAAPKTVPIHILTRWRPAEVAAGLSNLEMFGIAKKRAHTGSGLLHSLHAKLYLAYEDCLVGSDTCAGAIADLDDLLPPPGMGREAFTGYISAALYLL